MPPKKEGYLLTLGILVLVIIVSVVAFSIPYDDPLSLVVRLFALYGFLFLSIATIMTPFLKEVTRLFGKPFIKVHHVFATLGLASATLHPVAFSIQVQNILVFLPSFASWYAFWSLAGRPALIIIYIALIAVLIRRKIQNYWRPVHALMYIVLFFGIVHANLIGTDFQNIGILIIFNLLFAAAIVAFILKRLQQYQLKKRRTRKNV
jgi:DMSO/TMAO reductase YedYZ heme-binding membrane subunit